MSNQHIDQFNHDALRSDLDRTIESLQSEIRKAYENLGMVTSEQHRIEDENTILREAVRDLGDLLDRLYLKDSDVSLGECHEDMLRVAYKHRKSFVLARGEK